MGTATVGQQLRPNHWVPGAIDPQNRDVATVVSGLVEETTLASLHIDHIGVVIAGITIVQGHEQLVGGLPIGPDPNRLHPLGRREVLALTGARVDPHQNGVLIAIPIPG